MPSLQQIQEMRYYKSATYQEEIKDELINCLINKNNKFKDIIIIVRDQLEYVKKCIDSIFKNTENFNLYIYDNNSSVETNDYLKSIPNVNLTVSKENDGFLLPNNILAKKSKSDYIILLNSDTEVFQDWDHMMISQLEADPNLGQVGYCGSKLNEEFKGGPAHYGYDIDYVCGWCCCIPRKIYQEFGLFDEEHLNLAYCEDADLSLRVKEKGYKIYAMYSDLVTHYENKTILEVSKDSSQKERFTKAFKENHAYMLKRWSAFVHNSSSQF